MKLQGRDLSNPMRGDDVKLLHMELTHLGYLISDDEVARGFFGKVTADVVMKFQADHQLKASGIVDANTAAAINRDFDALPIVLGQVRKGDRKPFTGEKVQAFDKDLREEQFLGEVALTDQGRYEIRYSAAKFARAEKRLADLIVRVVDRAGNVLFSSDVIFNAPSRHTVDIVLGVPTSTSEFERYMIDIKPLLDNVRPAEPTKLADLSKRL